MILQNTRDIIRYLPKTVNGPSTPERASTSPAAWTAATRVERSELLAAMSTIFEVADVGRRTLLMAWMTPLLASTSTRPSSTRSSASS